MSIEATSPRFRTEVPSLTIALPGWLWSLIKRVRASRQIARDERTVAELPAHLRYDLGALDCIPSHVSRAQVRRSYQEALEAQWQRGV